MRRGRVRVLALTALAAALPSCALAELLPGEPVVATELHAEKVKLGAGLDQASASARLAEAAKLYVLPAEKEPGRLPMRNRRAQEIRVKIDGAIVRLDLMNAGGTSPIRHISDDRQLAQEYAQVVHIARRVLTQPAEPPRVEPSKPSKPESKPQKR